MISTIVKNVNDRREGRSGQQPAEAREDGASDDNPMQSGSTTEKRLLQRSSPIIALSLVYGALYGALASLSLTNTDGGIQNLLQSLGSPDSSLFQNLLTKLTQFASGGGANVILSPSGNPEM